MKAKGIPGKFKKAVFWLDDEFPLIGRPLVKGLRFIRYYFYALLYYFRGVSRFEIQDLNKVYWIDPQEIAYYGKRFIPFENRGKVLGGDWDLKVGRFKDLEAYKAFEERFKNNKSWQETGFYSRILERINKGEILWRCRNKRQLEERFKRIDNLCYKIRNEGYKLNREVKLKNESEDYPRRKIDEVTVNIGRNGNFLFNDGAHRLNIAKLLQISKIPVIVVVRHKKWADFKRKLIFYANCQGGKLYQPAYHFDLEDIPFTYGPERFKLIKNNTSLSKGKVLDIGANLGYFCHRLEQLGFNCYAVEINPQDVYFMRKLRDANGDHFEIIRQSIFEYKKGRILDFDIVLALNIFHHFLKRKSNYQQLIQLLKRIKARELFLETHNPQEEQMKGVYRNYSPEKFIGFILKNSCFRKSQLIDKLEGGRFLYKLSLK